MTLCSFLKKSVTAEKIRFSDGDYVGLTKKRIGSLLRLRLRGWDYCSGMVS